MNRNELINNILSDIKVDLDEEFDRNFERKAFFDRPWAPLSRSYNPSEGSMLMRTGALRRSLTSRRDGTRLIYSSSLSYAGLMNHGGTVKQEFTPSPRMRRWAWANYYGMRKGGDEVGAEQYRRMALAKRIKRTFTVPARPFVGEHPEVWRIAGEVAAEHANRAIDEEISKFNHK